MLNEGERFPQFSLANQDGTTRTLSDYAGRWLVVYIYPKDDTPGCTIQGKSFSATKADYDAAGIHVVGVSADDVESHKNFCNKFSLVVELLADPEEKLLKALGVPQSEWKGVQYWSRSTFVVDPSGTIRKVYANVNPNGHEQALLADINGMKQSAAS